MNVYVVVMETNVEESNEVHTRSEVQAVFTNAFDALGYIEAETNENYEPARPTGLAISAFRVLNTDEDYNEEVIYSIEEHKLFENLEEVGV